VKLLLLIGLFVFLSACQVFNRPDTQSTLSSQNATFVAEATSIPQTAQVESTQLYETVVAGEATITQGSSINLQLMATARVLIPPTPARVGTGGGVVGTSTSNTGVLQFVETHTASVIRETDGCAADSQAQFSPESPRIYAASRALNVRAGTQMSVEWYYEGQMVWPESFTVSQDDDDFCLWFYIDPQTVSFSPGNWTVRLYADGTAVQPDMTFTIQANGTEGG
jgi:hypothetical protein